MTIPGNPTWIVGRLLRLLAPFLVVAAGAISAQAAQIDLTSCVTKQVKICAMEEDWKGDENVAGEHIFEKGETKHFTCRANCKFWITESCTNGSCVKCGHITKGFWVDHSRGKGNYQLVSLAKTGVPHNPAYKSADIVKVKAGTACPN